MDELAIYNAWIWKMTFNLITMYSRINFIMCAYIIMIKRLQSVGVVHAYVDQKVMR